ARRRCDCRRAPAVGRRAPPLPRRAPRRAVRLARRRPAPVASTNDRPRTPGHPPQRTSPSFPRPTASPRYCPLGPCSWPDGVPFISPPPPVAPPPVSADLHFSTSDSLMTMVSATSFTDRPVCRYLLTCLQLTSAA